MRSSDYNARHRSKKRHTKADMQKKSPVLDIERHFSPWRVIVPIKECCVRMPIKKIGRRGAYEVKETKALRKKSKSSILKT